MILINSSPKDAAKIFQQFMPVYVPIGIGYLAAVMEQNGLKVKIIDEQVVDDTIAKIIEYTKELTPPYIFGFSVLTASYKAALKTSKKLKELYPDSIIIFGGPHPTALPEEVLTNTEVDIVVKGEGELILPDLYRKLKSKYDYSDIKSISFKRGNEIIHNERCPVITDLDTLPMFPYHLFENTPEYDMGFIASSRGCPHNCIFCSNRITTGKKYRYRSPELTVDELCLINEKYSPKMVLFFDDNLLVNHKRIYRLMELIKEKGLHKKMKFSFQARGDNVNETILKDLHESGFQSIFFGLETSSEEIMKILKKGETVSQCIKAVKMAKKAGFHVSATFIYGLPTENHQVRMDCAELANELELDMVRFNNATPYPGTELYEIAKNEGRLNVQGLFENFNSVSTFIENPFKKIPFSYVPRNNSEEEIRNDILLSYFKFYLNFKKIKGIFAKHDEGVGWFSSGTKRFDKIKKIPALSVMSFYMAVKFLQMLCFNIKRLIVH